MSDFRQLIGLDEPAITGAQWWQDSVEGEISRRATLLGIGVGVVAAAAACFGIAEGISANNPPENVESRPALDMQRRFGWSFGANGQPLIVSPLALELRTDVEAAQRAILQRDLSMVPPEVALQPYYAAALLEVPTAKPTETPTADPTPAQPFVEAYRGIDETAVGRSYRVGAAVARCLGASAVNTALIVDLTGPTSMALAAGAADVFSPVLMMQNWPHPFGVVKTHLALASLAIFFDRFSRTRALRKQPAPPAFVLDRSRLSAHDDTAMEFDNRYRVTLPPASALAAIGIAHVFYVSPDDSVSPDLYDRLSEYDRSGKLAVRRISPTEFSPDGKGTNDTGAILVPPLGFGGEETAAVFRASYLGDKGPTYGSAYLWRLPAKAPPAPPASLGVVPIVLAGGLILGAEMARRRGTWSRTSSSSSGGGG